MRTNRKVFGRHGALPVLLVFLTLGAVPVSAQDIFITSFSPLVAQVGDTVTINGFFGAAGTNEVYFNGVYAGRVTGNGSSITAVVPDGARFGPISVTNTGDSLTAHSSQFFTPTFSGVDGLDAGSFVHNSIESRDVFTVGSHPTDIVTADVDGDGKPDLVTANAHDNTISVLRNTTTDGRLSFAGKADFSVGAFPVQVATADIDGDGKQDVVTANAGDSTLTILRNKSTSDSVGFATPIPIKLTLPPQFDHPSLAIGDLKNNGKPDIALTQAGPSDTLGSDTPGRVTLLSNTSTADSISFEETTLTLGFNLGALVMGDLNRNDTLDLAIVQLGGIIYRDTLPPVHIQQSVMVLKNRGSFAFDTTTVFRKSGISSYSSLSIGDLNADSLLDLTVRFGSDAGHPGVLPVAVMLRNTSTAGGAVSFYPRDQYLLSLNRPKSLALADLDGNGKPDLAYTSDSAHPMVALGNTTPADSSGFSFETPISYAAQTCQNNQSGTIGDLDMDGRPDLAFPASCSGQVYVLRHRPIPTITSIAPTVAKVGEPITITGKGFDTHSIHHEVSFNGTFAFRTEVKSPTEIEVNVPPGALPGPISVTVDGQAEASTPFSTGLTGSSAQFFIPTFAGGGAGLDATAFTPVTPQTETGPEPSAIVLGDFDGDRLLDLVTANDGGATVSTMRNESTPGNIQLAAKVDFEVADNPQAAATGDLDGDGRLDLVVASPGPNDGGAALTVLHNASSEEAIQFVRVTPDLTAGAGVFSVAVGDVDGDGKPDIVTANIAANSVSVLRNSSRWGLLSFASKVDFPAGSSPFSVRLGDVDGDGKPDIVTTNVGEGSVAVLRNTSSLGTPRFAEAVKFATAANPEPMALGDLDGDGKLDLAVGCADCDSVVVYRNTSIVGTIRFASKLEVATELNAAALSLSDLDGDGKLDLAVLNTDTLSVFLNDKSSIGNISFADPFFLRVPGGTANSYLSALATGDLDGDGIPDLSMVRVDSVSIDSIAVFRNQGRKDTAPAAR